MRVFTVLVAAYVFACGFLFFRQEQMIYVPQREVENTPRDFGCGYGEFTISADARGKMLSGWWLPAGPGVHSDKAILYLHGNSGSVGANAAHACRLAKFGYPVLIFDYRGYGKSSDEFPNEQRIYEDSESAWRYLTSASQQGRAQVEPRNVILYGHSMGGAVAIEMAKRHPNAAGLIMESAFTSLLDMALENPKYRIFPLELLMTQRMDSVHKLASLKMPVLFIHGTIDEVVPFHMSEELFAAAHQPKTFVGIENAGHENAAEIGGEKYSDAVHKFVSSIESAAPVPVAVSTGH